MAIGYIQFKTAQEMEAYLNKSDTIFPDQTKRDYVKFVDRVKLQVWESFYCPELDY
jgi:hypothetical protein